MAPAAAMTTIIRETNELALFLWPSASFAVGALLEGTRNTRPFVMTNIKTDVGVDAVIASIMQQGGLRR